MSLLQEFSAYVCMFGLLDDGKGLRPELADAQVRGRLTLRTINSPYDLAQHISVAEQKNLRITVYHTTMHNFRSVFGVRGLSTPLN
jgi:hypothetical protein